MTAMRRTAERIYRCAWENATKPPTRAWGMHGSANEIVWRLLREWNTDNPGHTCEFVAPFMGKLCDLIDVRYPEHPTSAITRADTVVFLHHLSVVGFISFALLPLPEVRERNL